MKCQRKGCQELGTEPIVLVNAETGEKKNRTVCVIHLQEVQRVSTETLRELARQSK